MFILVRVFTKCLNMGRLSKGLKKKRKGNKMKIVYLHQKPIFAGKEKDLEYFFRYVIGPDLLEDEYVVESITNKELEKISKKYSQPCLWCKKPVEFKHFMGALNLPFCSGACEIEHCSRMDGK